MNTDESAEQVRRRMAELRRDLEHDVREVGRSARVMTDWTFYVRKFPWAVAAVAVAAGYLLVPKKKAPVIKPDPELLAQWIKEHKIDLDSVAARPEKASMIKSLAMMGVTWAARTGIAYITQRMTEAAQQTAQAPPEPEQEQNPEPSPLHEPWTSS